jgi:2-succinyl-5-enolpyruvyl-6-hydroxy-3-cyclohexene-1-carboxylate synthase
LILEQINDIASICSGHGVKTAIISPGSRSAPLTLAFSRHPEIDCKVISDERSAAFIALGIAQQQKLPVVLICTSGSAALNYAPAIAEAYYQEIPLIVLTADRPPEWIDQYDGQTINQNGIFGNHVKRSFTFPSQVSNEDVKWHCNRIINESILCTKSIPFGPVHVNIPLREPFYPGKDEKTTFNAVRIIKKNEFSGSLNAVDLLELNEEWEKFDSKAIVIGQCTSSISLENLLEAFSTTTNTPVIADIISNQHGAGNIKFQDLFLNPKLERNNQSLTPDLLITFGKSLISKNLKTFIRNNPPKAHWHISPSERLNDSLQNVTRLVKIQPEEFLKLFKPKPAKKDFYLLWKGQNDKTKALVSEYINKCEFGELKAVAKCLEALPQNSQLHLANSMTVRYANILGVTSADQIDVFANRGTSGIDGSNSTAVGAALSQNKIVTLITGDMAFFYDRNAFWHNYNLKNLRVIILNNHAGGIFRLIEGPASQPELEPYFETHQGLNAKNTAADFNFDYKFVAHENELYDHLTDFYGASENAKILEIESSSVLNASIFSKLKQTINDQL